MAQQRGERSNAALVGTCKVDRIQSRRKLLKAADTQAERQRVVGVDQIVLQQHLAGTRLRSACSSSSPNPAMRGSRGTPLAFLWGFQRGYSLRKENTPFGYAAPAADQLSVIAEKVIEEIPRIGVIAVAAVAVIAVAVVAVVGALVGIARLRRFGHGVEGELYLDRLALAVDG